MNTAVPSFPLPLFHQHHRPPFADLAGRNLLPVPLLPTVFVSVSVILPSIYLPAQLKDRFCKEAFPTMLPCSHPFPKLLFFLNLSILAPQSHTVCTELSLSDVKLPNLFHLNT